VKKNGNDEQAQQDLSGMTYRLTSLKYAMKEIGKMAAWF